MKALWQDTKRNRKWHSRLHSGSLRVSISLTGSFQTIVSFVYFSLSFDCCWTLSRNLVILTSSSQRTKGGNQEKTKRRQSLYRTRLWCVEIFRSSEKKTGMNRIRAAINLNDYTFRMRRTFCYKVEAAAYIKKRPSHKHTRERWDMTITSCACPPLETIDALMRTHVTTKSEMLTAHRQKGRREEKFKNLIIIEEGCAHVTNGHPFHGGSR